MGSYENSYQRSQGLPTAVDRRNGLQARSSISQLLNSRPQSVQLRRLQAAMDVSPRVRQLASLGSTVNGGLPGQRIATTPALAEAGVKPIQLVQGTVARTSGTASAAPIQFLRGTVGQAPKNPHHQALIIRGDDGGFYGVPFGVDVQAGDVVDFDVDPNASHLATNVVRVDAEDTGKNEVDLDEIASEFGEDEFGEIRKALEAAQKVQNVSAAINFLTELDDPADVMGEIPGYDWLTLHRRLLAAGDLRKTPKKGGSQKLSRNRVKASITLVIEDSEGNVRPFTYVIKTDFVSGESSSQSKVSAWLEEIGRGPYDSAQHAHSEQDLGVFLRETGNLEALGEALGRGVKKGDTVSGFILDIVSYPNTVCNECYPSIDETLDRYVAPFFQQFFDNEDLEWLVNASAVNLFRGVGSRPETKGNWMEALVDYDQIGKEEKTTRQKAERDSRSSRSNKKRGFGSISEPKKKYPGQQAVRDAANQFATVHIATGDGLACYVRSIMLGLAASGVIAPDQVENLVGTVTGHLANVGLRMDQTMIDAGGLAAAEVRRVIAQLTEHVLDGGIDVGISVVLWDPDTDSFQHFVANNGTFQITLLYTPGHFDFLAM